MRGPIYFAFLCSGLSGLIYQVVWVRMLGNVFGNTIHSASLVVAVFMLGLGIGGYLAGVWADRRYQAAPESLLRAYAYVELLIGALGLGVSLLLPHLGELAAFVSSYTREPSGWYGLSATSHLARAGMASLLIGPIAFLMGGTLTLLIRHLVRADLTTGAWRIAVLYAVNTAGAALGAFLTDFVLVPEVGLMRTQVVAVGLNVVAGLVALWAAHRGLAAREGSRALPSGRITGLGTTPDVHHGPPGRERLETPKKAGRARADRGRPRRTPASTPIPEPYVTPFDGTGRTLFGTSLALALSGFAAMGMELVWFRHASILLGGYRAVFSLLLTVILGGIGLGALVGGAVHRRTKRPAEWFAAVQGAFVVSALLGLALADSRSIEAAAAFDPVARGAVGFAGAASGAQTASTRALAELWFNVRPILLEVAVPALFMGLAFPLGNAVVQRAEQAVGRRAGALYLANTLGAVCGSLVVGFVLLPWLGLQGSAAVLAAAAGLAIGPLFWAARSSAESRPAPFAAAFLACAGALAAWLVLPSDHVNVRALGAQVRPDHVVAMDEGLTELIAVTETPGQGRLLMTNGHAMSSTARWSQRYMRALAHLPLLVIEAPRSVLVIGFGVGNTTHAATLHPSVARVEVADLSRGILSHARYFRDANRDVLSDPRVTVFVNDGRQHLQMQPEASYDLVTLEPPPIAYAGVAALYSREFYALARSRLAPKGYLSQWLPSYQVPTDTTLSMIRAFLDVFPQAVLVSGAEADLLLLGTNDARIELDPARVAAALSAAPAARADLERLDLGSARRIAGMFLGSARTLADATRGSSPVTDDRPLQEYGVRSALNLGQAVPASVVNLGQVGSWCPRCFENGVAVPGVAGLETDLALADLAYRASPADVARARALPQPRVVAGSEYLGYITPESADLHNVLGMGLASSGALEDAIVEFRRALQLAPDSAPTYWHLGAALAGVGRGDEAIASLRRSVELDPSNQDARNDLATLTRRTRPPSSPW